MPADIRADRIAGSTLSRRAPFGILAAIVVGLALAGCAGATKTPQIIYTTPSPSPTPEPTPSPEPTPTPEPTPSPTPAPTLGPCPGYSLSATLAVSGGQAWQGGAGSKQATVVLKNDGSTRCVVKSKSQPVLLNGDQSILITGPVAGTPASLMLDPGKTLQTSVSTSNLCASPPIIAPVQVGFIMAGTGLVIVDAASSTDIGGVPPCNGDPSVPSGEMSMSSWAP
jgi:hypothetical protein